MLTVDLWARLMAPISAPTVYIGTCRVQTYLQKRGARNLVRLGETIVRSSGAVAFCTPYTVCVLPELCGPEFEHYSSVPLCSRPPFIKTTQYSWTSLCETHSAHALGHGAARDISWTGHADPIGSPSAPRAKNTVAVG